MARRKPVRSSLGSPDRIKFQPGQPSRNNQQPATWPSLIKTPMAGGLALNDSKGTFSADAILKKTASATFLADSLIVFKRLGTFTADAFMNPHGTFTANAILLGVRSGSFTADAYINAASPSHTSFTADAVITGAIVDNIANAINVFPSEAGGVAVATTSDISSFTTEANDPTDLADGLFGASMDHTGWVKLVVPSLSRVRISAAGSDDIEMNLFLYSGTPTSSSTHLYYDIGEVGASLKIPDPSSYPFSSRPGTPWARLEAGTYYLCVYPNNGSDEIFFFGTAVKLTVTRDYDPPIGNITDLSADAQDWFPGTQSTTVSATADASYFTSDSGDPTEVGVYNGSDAGYSGWVKMIVPHAATVDIDTFNSTMLDTILWVYDEIPTSSSVAIAFNDDAPSPPGPDGYFNHSQILNLDLAAGTYYILVVPYNGSVWNWTAGGEGPLVTVNIFRHADTTGAHEVTFTADAVLFRPTYFPADAILKKTVAWSANPTADVRILAYNIVSNTISLTSLPDAPVQDHLRIIWTMSSTPSETITNVPAKWQLLVDRLTATGLRERIYISRNFDDTPTSTFGTASSDSLFMYGFFIDVSNAGNLGFTGYTDAALNDTSINTPVFNTNYNNGLLLYFVHLHNGSFEQLGTNYTITPNLLTLARANPFPTNTDVLAFTNSTSPKESTELYNLAWTTYNGRNISDLHTRVMEIGQVGLFTADSYLISGGGTESRTFLADAVITQPVHSASFTADAVIRLTSERQFTADAYLIAGNRTGSFTADSVIKGLGTSYTFTANAVIRRPATLVSAQRTQFKRISTMHVVDHRPVPLSNYVPPKEPTKPKELTGVGIGNGCLPPCEPEAAGVGTNYGANGGAFRKSLVKCTSCGGNFYVDATNQIGLADISLSSTHACCVPPHFGSDHTFRMFVDYPNMPNKPFNLKAKLLWRGTADPLVVRVYANVPMPTLNIDECVAYSSGFSDTYWTSGDFIGTYVFSGTSTGTLDGDVYTFDDVPKSITLDPRSLSTTTFRFQLEDEANYHGAQFKPASYSGPFI